MDPLGVRLELVGEAKVEWTETRSVHKTIGHGKSKRKVTKHVTDKFNNQVSCLILNTSHVGAKDILMI